MTKCEFEKEICRRMNALKINFAKKDEYILVRLGKTKYQISILEPVEGDDRKCFVRLDRSDIKKCDCDAELVFIKPCTSYYLLQYLTKK